jgi:hypothetical protein
MTSGRAANPLARAAGLLPVNAWALIAVAATAVATALGFVYAYDQDVLFPDRHFPRTWVLVSVMAVGGIVGLVPFRIAGLSARVAAFAASLGAGMLIFGGANLANRGTGVVVLVAGVIAWLAVAAASHRRGASGGALVLGLAAAAAATFAMVAACVVFVSGDA